MAAAGRGDEARTAVRTTVRTRDGVGVSVAEWVLAFSGRMTQNPSVVLNAKAVAAAGRSMFTGVSSRG
jgi:hypothetical protein